MACFKPITGYRNNLGQVSFHNKGDKEPMQVPCGQCIGCRLERSRQWAMRCTHEASLHGNENVFITLTYNPENLPPDTGLRKKHFQNFMKDLRKYVYPIKIKFYMCGEYGEKGHPHYHAIIFNYNFKDWLYLFDSPGGEPIFTSPTLEKIWKKGFVTVGTVNFKSAGYVARYCMKKITGKAAEVRDPVTGLKPYERINSYTGEIHEILPEYSTMSRGGNYGHGIAHDWISRFTGDCYPKDYTTINGMRVKPPKYYDKYLRSIDAEMYDDIKQGRELSGYMSEENSESRLLARQIVKEAQYKKLKRSIL